MKQLWIITLLFLALPAFAKSPVLLAVPFSSQAPTGNWKNSMLQNGCEEVSAMMAMAWVNGEKLSPKEAEAKIIAISKYEQKEYGGYIDTAVVDTVARIFIGYYHYDQVEARNNIKVDDIIAALKLGQVVIVPVNGQKLRNPNYTAPGPLHHNLLIKGYDESTKEFITNDPGTRKGQGWRYKSELLFRAIADYPTGDHQKSSEIIKAMIIVKQK